MSISELLGQIAQAARARDVSIREIEHLREEIDQDCQRQATWLGRDMSDWLMKHLGRTPYWDVEHLAIKLDLDKSSNPPTYRFSGTYTSDGKMYDLPNYFIDWLARRGRE